jgi:hypothetical protein
MITAEHGPAGIGDKTRNRLLGKRNVPAEIEEEGLIAAAVWPAEVRRTGAPANTGTAVALNDGMHFGQEPKIFLKISMTGRMQSRQRPTMQRKTRGRSLPADAI